MDWLTDPMPGVEPWVVWAHLLTLGGAMFVLWDWPCSINRSASIAPNPAHGNKVFAASAGSGRRRKSATD